jgi:hypothetical protein
MKPDARNMRWNCSHLCADASMRVVEMYMADEAEWRATVARESHSA